MAMLNEILGAAARYQQMLTRKFGIIGGAPSPQLTPEITPVHLIPGGDEERILASEFLCAGNINQAAVPAVISGVQLYNPVNSGILLVVERMEWVVSLAAPVYGTVSTLGVFAGLPSAGGVTLRDTRVRPDSGGLYTRVPVGQLRKTDVGGMPQVLSANLFYRPDVVAFLSHAYESRVVLAPGWGLVVTVNTVNIGIFFSVAWREIQMAQGERGPF